MKSLLYLLLMGAFLNAQIDYGFNFSKSGSSGFQFLKIEIDALSASLGGAAATYNASSKIVNSNVAGIAGENISSFSFSSSKWLANSQINNVSYTHKYKSYYLGLSLSSFSIDKFEKTTVSMPSGTGNKVSAGNNLVGLAFAKSFTDKLSLGLQLKYVEEILDNYMFNNLMVDVGSLYKTGFRDIKIAFILQHFGPDISPIKMKFRSPLLFRVGISDVIFKSNINSLKLMFEVFHPTDDEDYSVIALEFSIFEKLFFRMGNQFNSDLFGISYGIGMYNISNIKSFNISIDYGLLSPNKLFNELHILSLTISR
tara:strand:- start:19399 stop:20334 length:936 start_codon:yes stop_codon:yes gene_type:complete